MKIGITGHTKGIGKGIYDRFAKEQVTGFSIANGYDIAYSESRKKIIEKISDYDVFVNNAFEKNGQTQLLKEIINLWHNTPKVIVHINSKAIFFNDTSIYSKQIQKNLSFGEYIQEKRKQQAIIENHILKGSPNILNVILGPVDSGYSNLLDCKKMHIKNVADYIFFCISNSHKTCTQQIILDVPNQSWSEISVK